jgi:hypothetical protein
MKVNVDGLRKRMAGALSNLIHRLHANMDEEGVIRADPYEIQMEMDDLRSTIGMFCCMFDESDEMFTDMSDEAAKIPWFNKENKEEC